MSQFVEIFLVDEEGILLRAFIKKTFFFYDGDPEEDSSPLVTALKEYYLNDAPPSLLCKGFDTPGGILIWKSELASTYGDDNCVEIGERLYLVDAAGERIWDEYAYEALANGTLPVGWKSIKRS